MASPEEIRAIRALQHTAAANGETMSFEQARRSVESPREDLTQANIAKLFAEIQALKTELAATKAELNGFRITGPGFAGQGPHGISFIAQKPPAQQLFQIPESINDGGENEVAKADTAFKLHFRTLKQGSNVSITQETDTVTINATGSGGTETITCSNEGSGEGLIFDTIDRDTTPGLEMVWPSPMGKLVSS